MDSNHPPRPISIGHLPMLPITMPTHKGGLQDLNLNLPYSCTSVWRPEPLVQSLPCKPSSYCPGRGTGVGPEACNPALRWPFVRLTSTTSTGGSSRFSASCASPLRYPQVLALTGIEPAYFQLAPYRPIDTSQRSHRLNSQSQDLWRLVEPVRLLSLQAVSRLNPVTFW